MRPPVDIKQLRRPSASAHHGKLPLCLASGLRSAQVTRRVALFEEARCFSLTETEALQSYQPHVLISSTSSLESLAEQVQTNALDLASVDRALVVITGCRDVPLRDPSRGLLWQAFGVPVYELLLSGEGVPVACECDAHEGWHALDGVSFSSIDGQLWFSFRRLMPQGTGLTGRIEEGTCPCGFAGKRVLDAAIDYRDPVRHYLAQTA